MNNEDQIPWGHEPLVVRDGIPHLPGDEPNNETLRAGHLASEMFARAIKRAVNPRSSSRGTTVSAWESIPGLADVTSRQSPEDQPLQPNPSSTAQAAGGSVFDWNAVRSEVGDLLAAHPALSSEVRLSEGEIQPHERGLLAHLRSPGAEFDATVRGVVPRQAGDGSWRPGGGSLDSRAVSVESKGNPPSGYPGSLVGHPGPLALMNLTGSEVGEGDGAGLSDATGSGNSSTLPDLPDFAVGLPGGNSVADQLAFAPWSPEPADQSSGVSPYSVDIQESSVASSAFGPVLSGQDGSGTDGSSALAVAGSLEDVSPPLTSPGVWSGHAGAQGADQADGSSLDLSKTNELLQQLLDEVRKGRQPFLPLNDRNSSV